MASPLVLLTRMQIRAAARRAWRGMRSVKGAIFGVIGAAVFVAWLGPTLFSSHVLPRTDPANSRAIAPLALLLATVATIIGTGRGDGMGKAENRAISFTPAEVNFLFPGPFTRRQLLLYKLSRTGAGALFAGLIFSVVLQRHATSWLAALITGVLGVVFIQLVTVGAILAAQAAGARAYSLGRRLVLAMVVGVIAVVLAPVARTLYEHGGGGILEAAQVLNQSAVSRVLLMPFVPFARAFTADGPIELLGWGAVAAAIDALLLFAILRLDADYREAALRASERQMVRRERMRRGIVQQMSMPTGVRRRSPLPMLPWLGGAGPTAWRQFVSAIRTSRGVLIFLLIAASFSFVPMLFGARSITAPVVAVVCWTTVLLTAMLRFDFRAEIDQLAWLKALPLGPTATAAGQLAAPTLFITLIQWIALGTAAVFGIGRERLMLCAALPFMLPLNLLIVGVENLMFLLLPNRTIGAAPGDLSTMGRQIVMVILRMLIIAAITAIAAGAGGIVFLLTRPAVIPALAAALVVLVASALSIIPLVGLAYRRFDPSRDLPA